MRTGIVLAGVIMMVTGLILLSITVISFGGNIGAILDLSNILNPKVETSGWFVSFVPQVAGLGMTAIGFLVFIAGLAASPTEKPITPQAPTPTTPQVLAICPNCKARVPTNSKYCRECGADLRPKS